MKRSAIAGLAVALTGLVAGCFGRFADDSAPDPPLKLETVSLTMLAEANDNWPARIALVRVPDNDLVSELLRMKPEAWFGDDGETFQLEHPEAVVNLWEVVPGTSPGPFEVKLGRFADKVAGVLFCGVRSSPSPLRFDRDEEVTILIGDEGCTLEGGEPH